uniref:Uncharacterized protein n=1 Tax=Sphaerodactylus townsendi TaxID=933632 RepID=A0ACB8ELG3_9SAUR
MHRNKQLKIFYKYITNNDFGFFGSSEGATCYQRGEGAEHWRSSCGGGAKDRKTVSGSRLSSTTEKCLPLFLYFGKARSMSCPPTSNCKVQKGSKKYMVRHWPGFSSLRAYPHDF